MPENLSFAEAAAIPLVTLTSYQAIISTAKCNAKSKLLVLGGSTSCGLMAMQIASAVGCKQITCTSSSVELCESFGAERVINYKESEWEQELKNENFDIIYDCVGGQKAWDDAGSNRVIASDGMFVTIVGDDPKMKINVGVVLSTAFSVFGRKIRSVFGNESYALCFQNAALNLDDVSKLIVEGKLRAVLDPSSPYAFEGVMEMVDKCMSLRSKGKLTLKVFDDGVPNETT